MRALLDLCRFRNALPAFDGDVEVSSEGSVLRLVRRGVQVPDAVARLEVDLSSGAVQLEWDGPSGSGRTEDLLADAPVTGPR